MEDQVLEIVRDLLRDLGKLQSGRTVTLDSSFERDLGMGSLDLVELLVRCETRFEIQLPDEIAEEAETPAAWVRAIVSGGHSAETETGYRIVQPAGAAPPAPRAAETLLDVLRYFASSAPDRVHIHLLDGDAGEAVRYGQLLAAAGKVASGLAAAGLKRDDAVAIMLPPGADFFHSFFGVMQAGGIAVPIYPPTGPDKIEEYVERQVQILRNAEIRFLITFDRARTVAQLLRRQIPGLIDAATVSELVRNRQRAPVETEPSQIALLQYTSGSTGDPKGVMLTHANVLANVRGIGAALRVRPGDAVVSWLPLYSDVGLIASWLFSLYHGVPLTQLSPLDFLNRPERWLWAIHHSRGTLSAAPNFAYELCARKVPAWTLEGLDLSCWRVAVNAGEAVLPATVARFTDRFQPFGFRPETFLPCYGLAENSVALALPPIDRVPRLDTIDRDVFQRRGQAQPARAGISFYSVGSPLAGHEIRVVDDAGRTLGERRQGRILFDGPCKTSGYYRGAASPEWLDTGDLGYLAEGDLFITGRRKDCIQKSGRNISPEDVERAVLDVTGVERGAVAAIGVLDSVAGTERLVVVAETRATDAEDLERIRGMVIAGVRDVLGFGPDRVALIPLGALPKTSNGKIRRGETCALYKAGKLRARQSPPWLQIVRLQSRNLGPLFGTWFETSMKRTSTAVNEAASSAAVWAAATAGQWDTSTCLAAIRRVLRLNDRRFQVAGREYLAGEEGRIFVANRATLDDPLVLLSVLPRAMLCDEAALRGLPPGLTYLVKPLLAGGAGPLRRRMEQELNAGRSVLVFADGRVGAAPSLSRYRLDPFQLSVASGAAIQPVGVIENDGELSVRIGPAWTAESAGTRDITTLRERARQEIVELCQ